jgi:hypothetical protein
MKNKRKEFFSELDKKVIAELPMLIDVFVSTFNKLNDYQNDVSDKIKTYVTGNIPKGFLINKKESSRNIFFPFVDDYNKNNINRLKNTFWIYSVFTLV